MKHLWFLVVVCLGFSNVSFALRCGHVLVGLGDYKNQVYEKCGEPSSIETRKKLIGKTFQDSSKTMGLQEYEEIEIEEWIYDFGPRRLRQYLRFENGELVDIENLGRGN